MGIRELLAAWDREGGGMPRCAGCTRDGADVAAVDPREIVVCTQARVEGWYSAWLVVDGRWWCPPCMRTALLGHVGRDAA